MIAQNDCEWHDMTSHPGLAGVQARVDAAAKAAGRAPGSVRLVAVSKTFAATELVPVLNAGQRRFGENRVQEADEKWPELRARSAGIELHLIGPLQSNKVRRAVALFDVIETLDREKIAAAIAREAAAAGRCPALFIQVNTGEEPQKAGIVSADLDDFVARMRRDYQLPVQGLMCIPPAQEEPSLHFAQLAKLAARNGLDNLSMGMSADFEVAIAFGATHVRVGSAIFGARG